MLPEARLVVPDHVIATNTDYAIRAGLLWGTIDGLRGLIDRMRREMGVPDCRVIATGGQARIIKDHIPEIHALEPNLVLEGIRIIHGWSESW
jgi:type III pantothenate kinase